MNEQEKIYSRRLMLKLGMAFGSLSLFGGSVFAQQKKRIPARKNMKNMTTPEENFKKLGLELPPTQTPKGVYKPYVIAGNFIYVSGHGPYLPDGDMMRGKIGAGVEMATGIRAAEQTGLAILSTLKSAVGSLNKIKRVVKVLGMVNCVDDFTQHPQVINGCSELFAKIWGEENGIGVRSAVGMNSLPLNISVEIEAMFEIGDQNHDNN